MTGPRDTRSTSTLAARDAAARAAVVGLLAQFSDAVASVDADAVRGVLALDAMPTGPALALVLAALDPATLTPDGQVAFVSAAERLSAWVASRQNTAIVAFAGATPHSRQLTVDGRHITLPEERRSELALECLWSEQHAQARVATARVLAADLPVTARALADGHLSPARVAVLVEGAGRLCARADALLEESLDPEQREQVTGIRTELLTLFEQRTVAYASTHAVSKVKQQVRRTVSAIDPRGAAERRARAARQCTSVTIEHHLDGMSSLTATMPSEQAVACLKLLDVVARNPERADMSRTLGERRADAMRALLLNGTSDDGASRVPVALHVTVDLETLVGLADEAAMLQGVGPVPADALRQLIAESRDVSLRRLITDPITGVVTDVGTNTYRLGDRLRALITTRDGTCRAPNCSQPAARCDIDHIQPFDRGGNSTPENLQLLCRRHHLLKTHASTTHSGRSPAMHDASAVESPMLVAAEDLAAVRERLATFERTLQIADDYNETPSAEQLWTARALDVDLAHAVSRAHLTTAQHIHAHGAIATALQHALRQHARTCPTRGSLPSAPAAFSATADDTPPF